MVHDYYMYVDDPAFVRDMLPGVRAVLQFFARHQKANGSLGPLPWWNYVDWTAEWRSGVPPREADGSSAPLDLQLLLAYDWAARLESALGSKAMADEYGAAAGRLRAQIRPLYWDEVRRLFADTPARKRFSQHASVLAVLAGVSTGDEARDHAGHGLPDGRREPFPPARGGPGRDAAHDVRPEPGLRVDGGLGPQDAAVG